MIEDNDIDEVKVETQKTETAVDLNLDMKRKWYKKPFWVQTLALIMIPIVIIIINYNAFMVGLIQLLIGLTGFNIGTIIVVLFVISGLLFMYFFLVTFYTGGITNTLVFAKLFKKKVMVYLDSNRILQFKIPETNEKSWLYDKLGEFGLDDGPPMWLKNGLVCRLFMYGYNISVNLDDIKHRNILKLDPKITEDRIRDARLQAVEEEKNFFSPKVFMFLIPAILVIGVAGYLLISVMQTGQCESKLTELAMNCGGAIKQVSAQNVTSTTLQDSMFKLPTMK